MARNLRGAAWQLPQPQGLRLLRALRPAIPGGGLCPHSHNMTAQAWPSGPHSTQQEGGRAEGRSSLHNFCVTLNGRNFIRWSPTFVRGAGNVSLRSGTLPFPEDGDLRSDRQFPVSAAGVLVPQTPAPPRPLPIPGAPPYTEEETSAPYSLIIKITEACFLKRSRQIVGFIFCTYLVEKEGFRLIRPVSVPGHVYCIGPL